MAPLSAPHQGRAIGVLSAEILFLILPWILVGLRLWARRLKKTPLVFNDYAIILASVFTTGYNVNSMIASIKGGLAQHLRTLDSSELDVFLKFAVCSTFLWPTAVSLVKISVLHFYITIFPAKKVFIAASAVGAATVALWLSTVITAFAICRPFAFNWNKTIPGHCGNTSQYYLSTAIVNLIIDVTIVALPLPLLWGLHMRRSKKINLTAIFSLGALICIVSIIRIVAIKTESYADITYSTILDNITTALEPTLGVINACLPILQPVLSKFSSSTLFTRSMNWRSDDDSTLKRKLWSNRPHEQSSPVNSDRFHRLPGDLYPLTEATSTRIQFSGPDHDTRQDTDSVSDGLAAASGIKVKQDVGVYSTLASNR